MTLDLRTGTYKPYTKENDSQVYVYTQSNHPPTVLRSIPAGVNKKLSRISATKEIFEAAAPLFQEALNKSGYKHKQQFEQPEKQATKKKAHIGSDPRLLIEKKDGKWLQKR